VIKKAITALSTRTLKNRRAYLKSGKLNRGKAQSVKICLQQKKTFEKAEKVKVIFLSFFDKLDHLRILK